VSPNIFMYTLTSKKGSRPMEFYLVNSADGINTTNGSDQSYQWTYPPYLEHSPGKFAVYIFIAATFSVLGVFGNLLTIISVFRENVLRVPENMFLVSLATADILVAGCVLPFGIAGVVEGEAYFYHRVKLCEFLGAVCFLSCQCAFWSISGLAVNRMILLCFPKLYKRIFTWKTTPVIAFIPWSIALMSMLPMFLSWGRMEYHPESMICIFDYDDVRPKMFVFAVIFLLLLVTFVSIVVAHLKLNSKKRQLSSIAPNISLMEAFVDDSNSKHANYNVDDKTKQLRREMAEIAITGRLLKAIFIASLIWMPYVVVLLSHHIVNYGRDLWAFANLLGHMQPGLDFRVGYKNALCLIFCCKKQEYAAVENA
ncbi:unnamed protein product, partial [Owenia fusiformis]